jgi:hypothetical protein
MLVSDAQREVRTVFLGGSIGQFVSAMIWFISAAVATFVDPAKGFWTLAISGAAIFPLTQLLLRASGRPSACRPANPLNHLAMQIAFTVPLVLPVAGAATIARLGWFYPSCLIIVGAHYLPFIFLYGMRTFAGLSGALILAGVVLGFRYPDQVVIGGWIGGGILLLFAFLLFIAYRRELTSER